MDNNIFVTDPLIIEVLAKLDYKELSIMCQTNKTINSLCNGDYLWNLRMMNEYLDTSITVDSKAGDYVRLFGISPGYRVKDYYDILHSRSEPVELYIDNNFIRTIRVIDNDYDSIKNYFISYPLIVYVGDEILAISTPEDKYQFDDKDKFTLPPNRKRLPPKKLTGVEKVYIYTNLDTYKGFLDYINMFLHFKNNGIVYTRRGLHFPDGTIVNKEFMDQTKKYIKDSLSLVIENRTYSE